MSYYSFNKNKTNLQNLFFILILLIFFYVSVFRLSDGKMKRPCLDKSYNELDQRLIGQILDAHHLGYYQRWRENDSQIRRIHFVYF